MVSDKWWRDYMEALDDWSERVARDDPDWGLYFPGETRPLLPWWRRLLKL